MKIVNTFLLALSTFFLTSPVFAIRTEGGSEGEIVTDTSITSEPPKLDAGIDSIISSVMKLVFPMAGLVCVVFIIIGGYTWIASAGDPAKVKQAQGTLTWAIIGLIFVLIAALIISTVTDFLAE